MKFITTIPLLLLLSVAATAGSYLPQNSFGVPVTVVAGLDSDAVGNLYVLGLTNGAATYGVSGFRTPNLEPQFTFDAGISTPVAFAVEPSGIVDVLNGDAGTFTLRRFQNPGVFIGSATYTIGTSMNMISTAIDRTNGRVHIAYQYTIHPIYPMCLGCGGPSVITRTTINQYDLQGNLLKSTSMPGSDATPGSCYTPSKLAADPQGNLFVADQACGKLLKFSADQTLSGTYTASSWNANFIPRAMWTDSASSLYISQPVCGPSGCPQGIVKLSADGALQTSFLTDSPVGCAWDQRILYLSPAAASPIQRFIFANALSVPAETGPIGTVVQHSSAGSFGWQTSSSADGDPVTYSVYLATKATGLQQLGSASQASFISSPLAFGTTYFWQVIAQASYLGLPLQATQAPVVSFNQNLINRPPGAFSAAAGMGSIMTRATTAILAWQAPVDPDNDPLTYDVFWRPATQSSATLVGTTSDPSWTMSGLSFGSTYYWSVRARDVYGVASWLAGGAEQPYFSVFANTAPPAPTIIAGNGTTAQHTWSPQASLSWASVNDPEGDSVAYRLMVGTTPSALALVQDGTQTSYNLPAMVQNATYYWQVTAYDSYGAASTSTLQNLRTVIKNQPPAAFTAVSGSGMLATRDQAQLLAWSNALDPDGDTVTYDLALGTSPTGLVLVQSASLTSYTAAIQFGTTYYWQATARDGFGGAQTSAIQAFLPVFKNAAPNLPSVFIGTGTIAGHTKSPQAVVGWSGSSDPDGDPVAYRLYFGTSPATPALLQDGDATNAVIAGLQFETTYFWKVSVYDPYGGESMTATKSLLLRLVNQAPGVFDVVVGSGAVETRAQGDLLAWTAAADPDGDAVSYRVYFGTEQAALPLLVDSKQTSASVGPLAPGTTYYWKVDAYDTFAATTPMRGGVQSLLHLFKNSPPAPVAYVNTAATINLHTNSPSATLAWAASTDPDGDSVAYEFDLNPGTGISAVAVGTSTALTIPLVFDTPYQWRVIAADPFGGVSTGAWMSLVSHLSNLPPNPLQYLAPATLKTRATSYLLAWSDSGDPDGDGVFYRFDLGTSSAALSAVQLSSSPAFQLPLQFGTTVYYRVTAFDPFGASTAGGVQALLPIFLNDPPQSPNVMAPFKNSPVIKTMKNTVTVSWEQVTNPQNDPITYTVYLGNSAQNMAPLATIAPSALGGTAALALKPALLAPRAQVETDGTTVVLNLNGLDYYRSYYIQVVASNPYGAQSFAPVQTFSLASGDGFPKAYNYPNPFSPNGGGTNLVFNAPPSGYSKATVEIYSEWQDLLFQKDYFNIPPGISQARLDGRDRYGRPFFNGSYICRVRFSGPDDKTTFYLMVVK